MKFTITGEVVRRQRAVEVGSGRKPPVICNYRSRLDACKDCRAIYMRVAPNHERCDACRKAHEREYHRQYEQRRKAKQR